MSHTSMVVSSTASRTALQGRRPRVALKPPVRTRIWDSGAGVVATPLPALVSFQGGLQSTVIVQANISQRKILLV